MLWIETQNAAIFVGNTLQDLQRALRGDDNLTLAPLRQEFLVLVFKLAVIFIPSKRYCGCAVPVYGHTVFVLHASVSFFKRFFGFLIRINCANFGSSSLCNNNCEDEYPADRNIFNTTLINP